MISTIKDKLILGLLCLIIAGSVGFIAYKNHRDNQTTAANNKLAELIPLQHVNDSLAFKIAAMIPAEEIQKHLDKESQLARAIKTRDERILVLASAKTETNVPTFTVPIIRTVRIAGTFLKNDPWFDVSGWLDSVAVHFDYLRTRDSVTFVITQSKNGILYGYVANHSPYNRITNADFEIDSKQYYVPPWIRFDGFGIVGGIGWPGQNYLGLDIKATFWNVLELSPRFTVNNGVFTKSIEGRYRLPMF